MIPIIGASGSLLGPAASGAGGSGIWASLSSMLGGKGASAAGTSLADISSSIGQPSGKSIADMEKLNAHQNTSDKINAAFAGLKTFGTAFRGPDKTILNNIPRHQPPIIYPANIQNPGVVSLMDLMNFISRGQ